MNPACKVFSKYAVLTFVGTFNRSVHSILCSVQPGPAVRLGSYSKHITALKRHCSVSCCKSSSGRVIHCARVYRNLISWFHITYHMFSYLIVDCSFLFMSPSVCPLVSEQPCSCRRRVRAFLSSYFCPGFLDQLIELELTHCCFSHKSVKVLQG